MDWSPIDNNLGYTCVVEFEKQYPLPEWAKIIFSKTPLAIVPNDSEIRELAQVVTYSFETYLNELNNSKENSSRINYIVEAQNRYCENQQKNERTFSVLKAKLGEDRAKHFMNTILFPKIEKE
jgi:phycocyanobilin:ferredoxin oxidoreductase